MHKAINNRKIVEKMELHILVEWIKASNGLMISC